MTGLQPITLEQISELFDTKLQCVDARFDSLDSRLDSIDSRLHTVDSRLYTADSRLNVIDSRLDSLDTRLESLDSRVDKNESSLYSLQELSTSHFRLTQDVQRRVVILEDSVVDIQESLDFLSLAEEKDAEATINHELRIAALERINNLKSVPPTHLSEME